MASPGQELDLARSLKAIEGLKAELVGDVAELFKGMYTGSDSQISDALAELLVTAFLLGKRLGVGYSRLDVRVEQKLKAKIDQGHEMETLYGDLSSLLKHLHDNRG